jgi:hypothetical protein
LLLGRKKKRPQKTFFAKKRKKEEKSVGCFSGLFFCSFFFGRPLAYWLIGYWELGSGVQRAHPGGL